MSGTRRAAVLISGTGSNLQALIDAIAAGRLDLDICHVISNVADAPGLQRAEKAGIRTSVLEHGRFADRNDFDAALALLMAAGDPELVILAGFMRIIGDPVLEPFNGRMINLHPALLPLYKGLDTYNRVLEAGDAQTGASIHFVTAGLDSGPVISQVRIPVIPGDDADSLATRLHPEEHRLVVATVELFCQRKVHYEHGKVYHLGHAIEEPLLLGHDGSFD